MQNETIPQKKINTVNIDSLSHDGRGIAHINNKTLFLENALPEEEVEFVFTKQYSKLSIGKVTTCLKPSSARVTPVCQHYEICGGCSLQHLAHQQQIAFKTKVLQEQLKHIGGLTITSENVLPAIIGPSVGYRSKARLAAKYVQKKQKVLVGFHEKNGAYVVATSECPILKPEVGKKISLLSQLIGSLSIYQHIPQIEIACGDEITALVLRHLQNFSSKDIDLLQEFGAKHQMQFYSQAGGIETVKLITTHTASNDNLPSYQLINHGIEIIFTPTDFTQINHHINNQLVNHALELLAINPQEKVLDLFCGIGNFTLPIAKKCQHATGVEGNKNAVARAIQNAQHNNIKNAEFYCSDLTQESSDTWQQHQYDKILLDPPRTGAQEICTTIKKFGAQKIVYVSCNPATLARDAKEIVAQGYELQNITLVDMYPHTSHMETVASFVQ